MRKISVVIHRIVAYLVILGLVGAPGMAAGQGEQGDNAGSPQISLPMVSNGETADTTAASVPADFEDTLVTSVSGPIDMDWTPDGRMIIINKAGQVRVYANGALLPNPALDLAPRLCTVGEQGLVGLAIHPNFAANRYIYLYYIFNKFNNSCPESEIDGPVGRFSRFVLSNTNVIDPASELVLFETPPRYRNHHTGGDPKFGKDGYLYIPIGDAGGAEPWLAARSGYPCRQSCPHHGRRRHPSRQSLHRLGDRALQPDGQAAGRVCCRDEVPGNLLLRAAQSFPPGDGPECSGGPLPHK